MSEAKTTKKAPGKGHRWERDRDREKVRGKFIFHEVPGGAMSFVYKKYKEDPIERFDMIDGETYTIPLGVAKHLNTNGWYPEYSFMAGDKKTQNAFAPAFGQSAEQIMRIGKKIRRFSFQSLEFTDIEDLSSHAAPAQELVTIEVV